MKYKLFTLLVLLSVLTLSCDSNLYYFANEKPTVTVGDASIDVAYIQDNCNYVKTQYAAMEARGETLTEADRYRYASSIFACTGYNVVKNLGMIMGVEDTVVTDPYDMIFSLMGVDLIYQAKIDELRTQYNLAIGQCSYAKSDNFKLLCGFISATDNIIVMSEIIMVTLSATELVPNQKQLEKLLQAKSVQVGDLQNLIDGISAGNPRYLSNLTRNYFAVLEAVNILETVTPGISLVKILKELNVDLLDETTQRVSTAFLALKLYSLFKLDTVVTP